MPKLQPPENGHPLFSSTPPLKIEILSSPPFFENLVGGSIPSAERGVYNMIHERQVVNVE